MIDRIVLTKLSDPAQRADVAREVKARLAALPELRGLAVGVPGDAAAERSWDLSLVLSCEGAEALASLLGSPACVQVLALLEAQSECVKAWSFERA